MKKKPVIAIKIMREMLDITSTRLTNTSKFVSEMVRWGEWQIDPKLNGKNLAWQAKNFPKDYAKMVGVWPPEFADGKFQGPPWV